MEMLRWLIFVNAMNKEKKVWGLSIVAALFCPCCALPALLSVLGSTGAIAEFTWLVTLKPLFIAVAFISLAYLWRSYILHTRNTTGEACCTPDKPNPYHNKYFLIGLTLFICTMTIGPMLI